jgi:sodium transport system permease protein
MDLRQVWILYRHEVRCALRERSILTGSIIIPLVMYPLLLWAVSAGTTFVQGQADRMTSRVAITDAAAAPQVLTDSLGAHGRVTLTEWRDARAAALQAIADGRLDALVEFEAAAPDGAGSTDNFRVVVSYSEARERSAAALARVEAAVDAYRDTRIEAARRDLGVADPAWADFAVLRRDIATPDEIGRFILSLLVPLLTLIMVSLATFYPAIDATAGERERSTWETLMTVAVPRGAVAAAKYLYVATFGALGGLLNLGALALSLGWLLGTIGGEEAEALVGRGIPLGAMPVIVLGVTLLALFVAAGMLVFAVFARNFKEGQSMITPFYMLIFLPAFLVQSPDIEFTPALAAVPLVNVALLIREAVLGTLAPLQGGITILTMAVCVAAAVAFAQWVIAREEVLLGGQEGGLWKYLKGRRSPAGRSG